jgi:hypothetical protein
MRKLREVLRLRFELHLSYQQIGRSCSRPFAISRTSPPSMSSCGNIGT